MRRPVSPGWAEEQTPTPFLYHKLNLKRICLTAKSGVFEGKRRKKMEIKVSLQKLSEFSVLAKQKLNCNPKLISLCAQNKSFPDELSFHPSGKCGCIELNDEAMFDIRCDHLLWAEGWLEGIEPFMEGIEDKEAILICGNHKGTFTVRLLIFPDNE